MARLSCEVCRHIDVEEATTARGYPLHNDVAELSQCASSCESCESAKFRFETTIKHNGLVAVDQSQYQVTLVLNTAEMTVEGQQHENSDRTFDHTVWQGARLLKGPMRATWLSFWLMDKDDMKPDVGSRLCDVPQATSSPQSLGTARTWLRCCTTNQCLTGAPLLDNNIHTSTVPSIKWPSRFIEIIDLESGFLRLAETDKSINEYAVLSYTWGYEDPVWNTTSSNIHSRLEGFSIDELPATLADAVRVTWQLDLRFLWVDSICILQDGDQDWEIEAAKMQAVYGNALITLSANFGTGSSHGLFNQRSFSHFEGWEPQLKVRGKLDGEDRLLYIDSGPPGPSHYQRFVYLADLAYRAWCCQEHLLSHRILHFTESQLIWECDHGIQSEDCVINLRMDIDNSLFAKTHRYWRLWHVKRLLRGTQLQAESPDVELLLYYWYKVIRQQEYSQRELTFSKDRLTAISGVAKGIQRIHHMQYFGGLWSQDLVAGLCWSATALGSPASPYCAPS
jgi:hypothetical protein